MIGQNDPYVGQQLNDTYSVAEKLGQDSYAELYKVIDTKTQASFVGRIFHFPTIEPGWSDNFINIGYKLGGLYHEHTIQVINAGFDSQHNRPYLILDPKYADCTCFTDSLPVQQTLEEVLSFLEPLVQVLTLAHEKDIPHLDITLDNLFMFQEQPNQKTVMIGNFRGSPMLFSDFSDKDAEYGYPERFDESLGESGRRSDVYALATIIHTLIARRSPFHANTVRGVKKLHLRKARPTLPGYSRAVQDVMKKAWAIKPKDRYKSVREFIDALKKAHNKHLQLSTARFPEGSFSRRDFLVALVALLLTGLGYLIYLLLRSIPRPPITHRSPPPRATEPSLYGQQKHPNEVTVVHYLPDKSGRIISGDKDGYIYIWRPRRNTTPLIFTKHKENSLLPEIAAIAVESNSQYIASIDIDGNVYIWSIKTEGTNVLYEFHDIGGEGRISDMVWHRGHLIICRGKVIYVYDLNLDEKKHFLDPPPFTRHTDTVNALASPPDDRSSVVSVGDDSKAYVWEAEDFNGDDGHYHEMYGENDLHGDNITCVDWSPDGKLIATGSKDHTIQLWYGTKVDDTISVGDYYNTYLYAEDVSDPVRVNSVRWAPSGKQLVAGDSNGFLHLFTPQGLLKFPKFHAHDGEITSVAWSPDEKFFASASQDYLVKVWKMPD